MPKTPHGPARPQPSRRYNKRLSDKILSAFHLACDQRDLEGAQRLLAVFELMARRPGANPDGDERRTAQSLIAAHERLWHLQHPKRSDN